MTYLDALDAFPPTLENEMFQQNIKTSLPCMSQTLHRRNKILHDGSSIASNDTIPLQEITGRKKRIEVKNEVIKRLPQEAPKENSSLTSTTRTLENLKVFGTLIISSNTGFQHSFLVVDDDPIIGRIVSKILLKFGCTQVQVFESADAAYSVLKSSMENNDPYPPVDIILLDLQMPGMDGVSFLKVLKEMRNDSGIAGPWWRPTLPFTLGNDTILYFSTSHFFGERSLLLVMTGNAMLTEQQECFRHGAHAFLPKPVSTETLRRVLDQVQDLLENYKENHGFVCENI
jgi:CheY-like chemotaxis protein